MDTERPLPPLLRRPFPPPGASHQAFLQADHDRLRDARRWRIVVLMGAILVLSLLVPGDRTDVYVTLWGSAVGVQLLGVALLAHRVVEPGNLWGWSVRGQLLMALGMGMMFVNCLDVLRAVPFTLRVAMLVMGWWVLHLGIRHEKQADLERHCVR